MSELAFGVHETYTASAPDAESQDAHGRTTH
jgi:hypothetical protein